MSRFPTPRQFDAHKPLEVRIWFRWAGRDYEPGQPFNWKRNGIDQRRVRQMFDQGKLRFADEPVQQDEPVASPDPTEDDFEFDLAPSDELDAIESLAELKEIAEAEGAPTRRSKDEQRAAIREYRDG